MAHCFFVSDLHGRTSRYRRLWDAIEAERPQAVFLGGDLLPHGLDQSWAGDSQSGDFLADFLIPGFQELAERLGADYPQVFLILGNDDPRAHESRIQQAARSGLWVYVHDDVVAFGNRPVLGYACVPPTPFLLKDWERYDVSRFVDPGCIPPEEGRFTLPVDKRKLRDVTIQKDSRRLADRTALADAILLFHSPPYRTNLDRAALDGRTVDHAPLDVHVGSIAIQRFIAKRQPHITLHGHVHESARLTGSWRDRIGSCHLFSAAHDGSELALVRFDPEHPELAERELF